MSRDNQRMKTKGLMIETIIAIFIGIICLGYRSWMLKNISDFAGKDIIHSLIIAPVFFFMLAYILGRWIFHFTVLNVHKKAIYILFLIEAVIMCSYFIVLIFFAVIKYTNLWLENRLLQSCYAHILVFCGSPTHIILCIFAGVFFSMVITGRKLLQNIPELQ